MVLMVQIVLQVNIALMEQILPMLVMTSQLGIVHLQLVMMEVVLLLLVVQIVMAQELHSKSYVLQVNTLMRHQLPQVVIHQVV